MALFCRLILLLAVAVAALSLGQVFAQYTVLIVMLLGFAAWRKQGTWTGSGWSHGTGRLANFHDLWRGNLLGKTGLIIGRASLCDPPSRWRALCGLLNPCVSSVMACRMFLAAFWRRYDNSIIRVPDYVHAITLAPTGAGKGVSQQIPTLLSHRGSMVVVDPQGTLYKESAEHREKTFGHRIIRLDPLGFAGPAEESDALNVCTTLNENSPTFIDDIRSTADLFVRRDEKEFQPHFNDWAVAILATMLAFVCGCEADPARRNLCLVRDLVASRAAFTEATETMQKIRAFNGVIAKLGHMLTWLVDKELASILSSVHRHSAWMDSPPIAACLSRSTFDPRWLRSGKVTIYLILPSEKLSTLSPLMRLWIGTILRVLCRDGASEKHEVLFILDEAAHLGKLQILEDAITLMRAYGIRIWLFMQSVNQLQKVYGENAQTILDNMGTQIFFGTNAYESAEHISKRIGDCTILVDSINRNWNRSRSAGQRPDSESANFGSGSGITISEAGRSGAAAGRDSHFAAFNIYCLSYEQRTDRRGAGSLVRRSGIQQRTHWTAAWGWRGHPAGGGSNPGAQSGRGGERRQPSECRPDQACRLRSLLPSAGPAGGAVRLLRAGTARVRSPALSQPAAGVPAEPLPDSAVGRPFQLLGPVNVGQLT